VLEVASLRKAYAKTQALQDVSLNVDRGEFVTLLGPSGCGKTTTLMAISGFVDVDGGAVLLEGRDITHISPERRNMGVVFQSYALFPHMSVAENVGFPLRMRGSSRAAALRESHRVLELVQLSKEHYDAAPDQLSGGQKQRVAVARSLVFDPPILLMDEPLSALDRRLRQDLQLELRRLQREIGTTVIYVTHDQEEALVLSTRIAVMKAGRVEQVGRPDELYDRPHTPFVGAFLGESNRLKGSVAGVEAETITVDVQGTRGATGRLVRVQGDSATIGDLAEVLLRPEMVRIAPAKSRHRASWQEWPAVVRDVVFLGHEWRVDVELLCGAGAWTVRVPRQPIYGESSIPTIGANVTVMWRSEDAVFLHATSP
jgi:putative spermidine/putrescine transport system ATP-binding protein